MIKRFFPIIVTGLLLASCHGYALENMARQTSVAATVSSIQQTAVSATLTQMASEKAQTEQALVPNQSVTPTIELTPENYEPTGSLPPLGAYDGWQKYENPAYGFSFYYPAGWSVMPVVNLHTDQVNPNSIDVRPPAGTAILHVSFRSTNEAIQIAPTGMGSGEMVERGTILFIGEEVTRSVLVAQGNDVSVSYFGPGIELTRGSLVFVISCSDPNGWRPGQPGFSLDFEQTIDLIVTSFALPEQ
jgi:hypothetical protein